MGRRGQRALLGVAALGLIAAAAAPPIALLRWIAPGTDAIAAATRRPPECLAPPSDAAQRNRVEVGRAVFRTPLLLGGTAGNIGIACETCHRSGRGNPALAIDGVSGAPGTADVTSAMLGPHRSDGIANPKIVPDLAGPIDRSPARLRALMTELVVHEFAGRSPPEAVLDGLVAYVAALDARHCAAGDVAYRLADDIDAAARAVAAAGRALDRRDTPTAALLLAAARTELGRIAERFPRDASVVTRIVAASRSLQAIRLTRDPAAAARALAAWRGQWPKLAARLHAREARSLYDPTRLAAALR